jgi:ribosomal protein L11 methylase PrmA
MQRRHDALLRLLGEAAGELTGHVIDLGCGNGVLVGRIYEELACAGLAGVDVDPRKIEAARKRYPEFAAEFIEANIFDVAAWRKRDHYALVVLALPRLAEVAHQQAKAFVQSLRSCCEYVLVYDYDPLALRSLGTRMRGYGFKPSTISEPLAALASWRLG